jgi:hypothetical protein
LSFTAQTTDVSTGREPDGGTTIRSYFQPTPGASNIVPFVSGLSLNETLAINTTSLSDSNGEFDPWIEVYNFNTDPIDIGGLYISDDVNDVSKWQIPNTNSAVTTIPAGGFITLWADNQVEQGELHLPFTLSSVGGTILLSDIIGTEVSTIDTITYQEQIVNVSYGRYPDASIQLKSFISPTPNSNNILPLVTDIFINEFLAGNNETNTDDFGEYEDWVELYNAGSTAVDVGGLFMVDDLAETDPFQIPTTDPSLTTIQPGGFLLLWCDNQPTLGVLHMNIKLSGGGEQIGLLQINGSDRNFIDSLTYEAQIDDVSEGRSTDGGATFVAFSEPTPNASNVCETLTTYYIDADQDGYGDSNDTTGALFCDNPGEGYSLTNTDCNDANNNINPDSTEVCDDIDNNCDGFIDGEEDGVNCSTDLPIKVGDITNQSNVVGEQIIPFEVMATGGSSSANFSYSIS